LLYIYSEDSEIMPIQILSLALINGITGIIFFKYTCDYIYTKITTEHNDKISWLLSKINTLENELTELHESIDNLEETLIQKEAMLKQSSDRLDKFIISNYDTETKDKVEQPTIQE
jgi:predicted RNase H-like nuclease (RuvC/YqgF family)